REQDTYDEAINFAYSKLGDNDTAFDYCEQGRARSLLDATQPGARIAEKEFGQVMELGAGEKPLTSSQLISDIRGSQFVEYAVLNDKLLAWVTAGEPLKCFETDIKSSDLDEKVGQYLSRICGSASSEPSQKSELAKELHDLVWKRVETSLDKNKPV